MLRLCWLWRWFFASKLRGCKPWCMYWYYLQRTRNSYPRNSINNQWWCVSQPSDIYLCYRICIREQKYRHAKLWHQWVLERHLTKMYWCTVSWTEDPLRQSWPSWASSLSQSNWWGFILRLFLSFLCPYPVVSYIISPYLLWKGFLVLQ